MPCATAPMHLAVDDHRIDDAAGVVHHDVADEPHHAGFGIDLGLADVRAVAIGQRRRGKVDRGGEPRRHAVRQREARHAADGVRDLRQRLAHLRHAFDPHRAVLQFQIVRRRFQHFRGGLDRLVAHRDRGEMHRVAGGHGLAAGEGAEAQRRAGGVAGDHVDVVRRHAEHVADKLRQHGLDALALRARAGGDDDLAGRADAQARALERAAPGALDVVGEAEPEIAALLAAPPPAAPGNPPSRRPRARGAGTPDSRRCRRSWSSRRAA